MEIFLSSLGRCGGRTGPRHRDRQHQREQAAGGAQTDHAASGGAFLRDPRRRFDGRCSRRPCRKRGSRGRRRCRQGRSPKRGCLRRWRNGRGGGGRGRLLRRRQSARDRRQPHAAGQGIGRFGGVGISARRVSGHEIGNERRHFDRNLRRAQWRRAHERRLRQRALGIPLPARGHAREQRMEHAAECIDIAAFVAEPPGQHQLGSHERSPTAQSRDPFRGIDRCLCRHRMGIARQRNLQEPHPAGALTSSGTGRLATQGVERQTAVHGAAAMQLAHGRDDREHEPAGFGRRQRAQPGQFVGQRHAGHVFADDEPVPMHLLQGPGPTENRIDGVVGDRRPPDDLGPHVHPLAELAIENHDAHRTPRGLVAATEQPAGTIVFQPIHEPVVADEKRAGIAAEQPAPLPLRQDSPLDEPCCDRRRGGLVARGLRLVLGLARDLACMLPTQRGEHVPRHEAAGSDELPEILGSGRGHGGSESPG